MIDEVAALRSQVLQVLNNPFCKSGALRAQAREALEKLVEIAKVGHPVKSFFDEIDGCITKGNGFYTVEWFDDQDFLQEGYAEDDLASAVAQTLKRIKCLK